MKNFQDTFKNILPGVTITIERILSNDNIFKKFKLIPVQNSTFFYFGMQIHKDPLILPKLYAALTYLSGPGDNHYDDFKGSYSFIFKLNVDKNANINNYCYHIYHYRSYIEFSVSHIVLNSDPRDSRCYHQPDEKLFSEDDIRYFSIYFCNYALGYIKGAKYIPASFIKWSDSNLLLFGYLNEKYFCKDYKNEDRYRKQKDILIKQLT